MKVLRSPACQRSRGRGCTSPESCAQAVMHLLDGVSLVLSNEFLFEKYRENLDIARPVYTALSNSCFPGYVRAKEAM